MSIYVFVTRRDDPLDSTGPEITFDEWRQAVASDADLKIEKPPDIQPANQIDYAVWNAYPGDYPAWFGFVDGNIEVKGIDDALLSKLRIMASKLQARIVSEEGELFI
jgi:hypothetical protein